MLCKESELENILVVRLYAVSVEIFRNGNSERLDFYAEKEIVNRDSRI